MTIFSITRQWSVIILLFFLFLTLGCKKNNAPNPDGDQPGGSDGPVPEILGVSPLKGVPGTVIKIKGVNFNTNISENIVYVAGDPLEISSITSNEITAVIPPTAKLGKGAIAIYSARHPVTYHTQFTVLGGVQSDYFKAPNGLNIHYGALAEDGTFYGFTGTYIFKREADGRTSQMSGVGPDFKSVGGFAISVVNDLYVANRGNFNIVKIGKQKQTNVFAGSGIDGYQDGPAMTAKFVGPSAIAYYLGNFYVVDGHRIRKVSLLEGNVTTLAGSGVDGNVDGDGVNASFGNLEGIAVDDAGNVYVTDSKYLNIRKITPAGKVTTLAGSGSAGFKDGVASVAQFTRPRAIAVDPVRNIYVTDENSNLPYYSVRLINQVGNVYTFIKGTSNGPIVNGPIASSTTNSPLGLSFDLAGNLYIANSGDYTLSRVVFE